MRNYITQLSLQDYKKIYPEHELNIDKSSFPAVVAIISEDYPKLPTHSIREITLANAKHIYSTRDYWEVAINSCEKKHKIPKRYTKAIYLIEED
jgi:hypothetical protein